ncbi:MAG: hypothetical protein RIQ60_3066 [Pseudomonadota bacterium]|jgi:uncharacterized membrane protein YcfT
MTLPSPSPAAASIDTARSNSRYGWVDVAKGICIIAVVCLYARKELEHLLGDAGWLQPWAAFAQPFRMPDFFLLSGLFLGAVLDRPWRSYLDTKVVHYVYFLVLWVALVHGYEMAFSTDFVGSDDSPARALRRYVYYLYQPDHMLWFIQTLPMYFVVTRLLRRVPALVRVALAVCLLLYWPSTAVGAANNFCQYYLYFVLGSSGAQAIFAYADRVAAHRLLACLALPLWALANQMAVQSRWTLTGPGALCFGVAGIAAIIAVSRLLADTRQMPGVTVLRFLGANSIVVYLGFFIPLHALVTAYAGSARALPINLVATGIVLVSITVPVLLFITTRRTPLRYLFVRPRWAHLQAPRQGAMVPA